MDVWLVDGNVSKKIPPNLDSFAGKIAWKCVPLGVVSDYLWVGLSTIFFFKFILLVCNM